MIRTFMLSCFLFFLLSPCLAKSKKKEANRYHTKRGTAPTFSVAKGKATVSILFDKVKLGKARASMQLLVASPGLKIPPHQHKHSDEVLYFLEGKGRMSMTLKDGKVRWFWVKKGDSVYIPKGSVHSLDMTGLKKPLKAVQVYVLGGPEQRFRKGKRLK